MEFFSKKVNFYFDPNRQDYDTAFWHTFSGTPAVVAGNLVINAATIGGYADINSGEIAMSVLIPTDPTAGDVRQWGLAALNQGAYAYFSIVNDVFSVQVGDGIGNTRVQAVTWDTNWTGAEIEYKIIVTPAGWTFFVNKIEVAFIQQLFSTAIAATTQATADTLTDNAHGLTAGQKIVLSAIVTTTGIDDATIYYVISPTTNTFQIALTSGGSAVDLGTGDGTCNYQVWPDSTERKVPQSLYIRNSNADAMEIEYIAVLNAEVYSAGVTVNATVTADTEFPTAAALADASANPTTTSVGSHIFGFNGATWDRIRTGLTTIGSTFTGFLNILPWGIYHTTPTTRTDGQGGPLETDASGNLKVTSASGGSAGGGGNTYSTEQGDFTATPTNATFDIVLSVDSLGGSAITEANFANAILKVMDVSLTPDEFKTITLDKFTWTSATKTLDITNCTGAFTLGTGDVVSLTLVGVDKRDDRLNNATITNPIRDISDMYAEETLIDSTNLAAATNYYPDATGLSMAGYSNLSIQGMTGGGVTTTIEATNDDAASPDWLDVTAAFTNTIVNPPAIGASYVNVNFMLVPTLLQTGNFKAFRIKSVTSDATNNVQYNIRRIY